jgi:hypothetical protein
MEALGDVDRLAGVPASTIEDERDPLGGSGADIPGKGGEHLSEEDRGHGGE